MYVVDFDNRRAARLLDWNTMGIDWQGRGWDRGLRGIAFDGEVVYIAASDELFAFTPDFEPLGSWRNRYLKHCHEIARHERTLFLTSTGFDSILGFDLDSRIFSFGLRIEARGDGFIGLPFDPLFESGPQPSNALHLNNVYCAPGAMHVSGLRTDGLLAYNGRDLRRWVTLPAGVHNAQPFRDGVLFNDTAADVVRWVTRTAERTFPVPRFPPGASHARRPGRLASRTPGIRARSVRRRPGPDRVRLLAVDHRAARLARRWGHTPGHVDVRRAQRDPWPGGLAVWLAALRSRPGHVHAGWRLIHGPRWP